MADDDSKNPSIGAGERADGTPWLGAVVAGLGAFLLYVATLAPTTAFWDTSEYIATAHILGIPHPPGNPFFVVVAKVWSLLLAPTGLSVAVRINLFAAATSAVATGFFFLVAHRVLVGYFAQPTLARYGAGASAIIGATAFTVWNQSNVNEKVYTLSVMIIAAVSWLAVRWYDRRGEAGSERLLLTAVFLMAIGSTSHLMSVLPAPALGVLVLMAGAPRLLRADFVVRAAILVAVGISFNFVLPIRASLDPVINEGDPTCESATGAAVSVFTMGRAGCPGLSANLTREQYQTPPVTQRKATFGAQMATYLQYFEWQWARGLHPSELPQTARLPFTLLFLVLGAVGLASVWRVDRPLFAYLAVLAGTLTVGLVVYLNFRHGYSLHAGLDQSLREVRERDYFFVAGFLFWGTLAGMGVAWTWHTLASAMGGTRRNFGAASPVLVIAFIPLMLNWSWATRSADYAARDWAFDLLMSVEPYGVLFTNGDNDTFPLWYLQEVEGIRKDVTVVVGQYLYTDWYPKQLQDLTSPARQRTYDPGTFPDLHDERPVPSQSVTVLSQDVMDSVSAMRLPEDMTIPFPKLAVTYPQGMVLDRAQQLALLIINDSVGERPIFFSSSAGLMTQLGLERWGVRHGLTTKLDLRNLETDEHLGLVQGAPEYGADWYDLEQSLRLYDEVYLFRGLRDRDIWADRSTLMIPFQYYVLALQLSNVVELSGGDPEVVRALEEDALAFQIVSEGGLRGSPHRMAP
ncbi:MAG: DUF2723 domain-containing protein [Gemmatimonadetes bacterium]|nr:DUF2723 domain-containing protein [Gemmatimonadota bacterium]